MKKNDKEWEEVTVNAGLLERDDVVVLGEDQFKIRAINTNIPVDSLWPLRHAWIDLDLYHLGSGMIWSIKVPLNRCFKVFRGVS